MNPTMIAKGAVARFGLKPYPLSLTYEITWLCNLTCSYCDRHTPMRKEMTLEQILTALEQFRGLGMLETNLDGGEALAHRHVDEVIHWLVERGVVVNLNSNGILVPKKIETVRKVSFLKISLDGPAGPHDQMRGAGSFAKAVAGAKAAQDAGIRVEFSCVVGRHNAHALGELLDIVEGMKTAVVFQPALNSLFLETERDGAAWQLETDVIRGAFAKVEAYKKAGRGVGNAWSSLKHFRSFPEETKPPCAAGWVDATMDPEGVLFSCGQLNRADRANNVTVLGAETAFKNLVRKGCGQCWCARLVESNYMWGVRVDKMLPPLTVASAA